MDFKSFFVSAEVRDVTASGWVDAIRTRTWAAWSFVPVFVLFRASSSEGTAFAPDIEFSTAYKWGIDPDGEGGQTLDSSTFDVRDVGTHEVGHVVGLADLYQTNYSELTMYRYAAPAETLKRSLQNGDILGTQKLYGL
jgi:hypothetical protein